MDIGTIIGLVAGFLCIAASLLAGGDAAIFLNIPSMLIVVGGMVATTFIHFSVPQVMKFLPVVKKTLLFKLPTQKEVIQKLVNYAAINRRDGSLALEKQIPHAGDPFLVKGIKMIVDGVDQEQIEKLLNLEIDNLSERHAVGRKILEFMGAAAPAFGMIGTLIGLVQMLGSLEDPSSIGLGMATALITTFYGAVLANLFFIPMSGKLGMRSQTESLLRAMIIEGVVAIAAGEAPTTVKERMQTFISGGQRFNVRPKI
jgi:chemotaxis protein MotA